MNTSPLVRLFARHYHYPEAALERFRDHLSTADLDFAVEANITEIPSPDQPGFPKNMPSSIYYFTPKCRGQSPLSNPNILRAATFRNGAQRVNPCLNMYLPSFQEYRSVAKRPFILRGGLDWRRRFS